MAQGSGYNLISPFSNQSLTLGGATVTGTLAVNGPLIVGTSASAIIIQNNATNTLDVGYQTTALKFGSGVCYQNMQVNTSNSSGGYGVVIGNNLNSLALVTVSGSQASVTAQCTDSATAAKAGYLLMGEYQQVKASSYTLVFGDMDKTFTNAGATGTVVFTLPSPLLGYRAKFLSVAQQTIAVTAPSGSVYGPGSLTGATRTIGSTTAGQYSSFTVISDGTNYYATEITGTVT